jgi:hypothetical protein
MTEHPAFFDLPEAHSRALAWLLENIPPDKFLWVLTGSGGLRLNGVDIPVHDLDIQTDLETIYRIEQRLAAYMTVPVHSWESPGMHSLDGKAEIEGIQVELLANITHKLPDGSWGAYTDFSRIVWVEMRGLRIPTFPLENELEAYIAMGRTEKAALIRKTLSSL